MRKTNKIVASIMLSLTMAVSGMAGVTAPLSMVYAEEKEPETKVDTYTYADAIANPNGIAKSGFKFLGWFADPGCTVAPVFEGADPAAAIYAKYIERTDAEDDEEDEILEEGEAYETGENVDGLAGSDNGSQEVIPAEYTEVPDGIAQGTDGENVQIPAENTEQVQPAAEGTAEEVPSENAVEEDAEAEGMTEEVPEAAAQEAAPAEEAAPEEAAEAAEEAKAAPVEDEAKEAKADDGLQKAGTEYTVTFDVQGKGTAPAAVKVEEGKTAEDKKPADPTADGYTFGGWFTDKEGTTAYTFKEAVKADITLYAKWTPVTHTVTFSTTRGTAPAAQTVNHGATATKPALTDVGYTCTGWTSGGTAYDFATPVTADLTLTAVWRPNVYTVHFDPNNSALASATGATADMSCTYDKEANLSKNGFVRNADWEFIGWNTAANRSGTAYADQAAVKNLTAEDGATVTLYAQWRFIYKMLAGAGASVSKLDTRGLTFQTNGFYSLFTGIAVDGTIVAANNYTASAGNYGTFVTLKQDFIKNLSIGQHTIQFLYQDGSVSCVFYVNNSTILNPVQTGDNSNNALWMSLLAGAAALAVGFVLLKKKFRV